MPKAMTEILKVRTPAYLVVALETEAQRQMLSRSALVRRTLAAAFGLLDLEDGDGNESKGGDGNGRE